MTDIVLAFEKCLHGLQLSYRKASRINLYPDLWNQRFQCLVTMCMGQLYGKSLFTHFNISWTRNRELQGRTYNFVTLQEIYSLENEQNDSMTGIRTTASSETIGYFAGVISSFITQHPCLRQTTRDRTSVTIARPRGLLTLYLTFADFQGVHSSRRVKHTVCLSELFSVLRGRCLLLFRVKGQGHIIT